MSRLTLLFPLWALLLSIVAYFQPMLFSGLKDGIVPLLMAVMFGMGFTLRWGDFEAVWALKRVVTLGVLVQYSVMPLAAFLIAHLLALSPELTVGMVLVGATAGVCCMIPRNVTYIKNIGFIDLFLNCYLPLC